MKKVFALLLSVMVLYSLTVISAGAVDIKISGTATGYDAYRILELSQAVKPGHEETDDCPIEGCDKAADPSGHWNYAYSFNEKYRVAIVAGLKAVDIDGELDDRWMVASIGEFDAELTRMFADAVYMGVKGLEPEYSVAGSELAGVEPGYYLIAEKANTDAGDSVSLVMLDTAGLEEVRVTTKEDVPTLEKKTTGDVVTYFSDDKYGWDDGVITDSEIRAVGETVWYELRSELPSLEFLRGYNKYRLVFHDDVSAGLRVIPDSIECSMVINGEVYELNFVGQLCDGDTIIPDSILIRGDGDVMLDDACDLEVVFDDIKSIPVMADALSGVVSFGGVVDKKVYTGPSIIRIRYACEVTESAVVGKGGNPNTAHLEFSNNPYVEGPTTRTPDDKCTVFTFGIHVNKTDGNRPLSGVEFTLYTWVEGYYDFDLREYIPDGWYEMSSMRPVEGSEGTQFEAIGLGVGMYELVETKTPDGYQKCDDIEFEIVANCEEISDDPKLTKLEVLDMDGNSMTGEDGVFWIDTDTGMIMTEIANYSGAKLPSTGGSGVYWIYGLGGLMVVGAIAGLWRKQRRGTL